MRGMPKHLNSKTDYLYLKQEFQPDQWRPRFQVLLDERYSWLPMGPLADGEPGIEDDSHRIVEHTDEAGQVVERIQEEYREDPNALIFRLGFTVVEVEGLLFPLT